MLYTCTGFPIHLPLLINSYSSLRWFAISVNTLITLLQAYNHWRETYNRSLTSEMSILQLGLTCSNFHETPPFHDVTHFISMFQMLLPLTFARIQP